MLKRILDALHALLSDAPVFNRLLEQLKAWGQTQEEARNRLIGVLTDVVQSFEKAHATVLIELAILTNSRTPEEYRTGIDRLNRDKLYELFKTKEVCEHLHQLMAEATSGFGDIQDAIVLGAAKRLRRALGEFEEYEYTLAERYENYLRKTLLGSYRVNTEDDLNEAREALVDQEEELVTELRELTAFKRQILRLSLYGGA